MATPPPIVGFLLLLGLAFFFGLAFEEFHAKGGEARPGGVRTFPLLALAGGLLYRLDPNRLLPLSIGLLVPTITQPPANPLELSTAFVFAALFVAISVASSWVRLRYGQSGLYGLAAIVGCADIDPFVLNIAAGGAGPLPITAGVVAILIAAASNNLLKAIYTTAFAGIRAAMMPAAALVVLALIGLAAAWWIAIAAG